MTAISNDFGGVCMNQLGDGFPVSKIACQSKGVFHAPGRRQCLGRLAFERRHIGGRQGGPRPIQQKLAKQRMIDVRWILLAMAIGKKAATGEAGQHRIGLLVPRKARGQIRGHVRQEGGSHEEIPATGIEKVEHLGGKIIEQISAGSEFIVEVAIAGRLRSCQEKHEAGGPTLRFFHDRAQGRPVGGRSRPFVEQSQRLIFVEPELAPIQADDLSLSTEPRKHRVGLRPADDDGTAAARHFGQAVSDNLVKPRVRCGLLKIVEHHNERLTQAGKQNAEELPGERRKSGNKLRFELRR